MKIVSIVASFALGVPVDEFLTNLGFERTESQGDFIENTYMKLNGLIPRYCLETTSGKSATVVNALVNLPGIERVDQHEEFARKIWKKTRRKGA